MKSKLELIITLKEPLGSGSKACLKRFTKRVEMNLEELCERLNKEQLSYTLVTNSDYSETGNEQLKH